MYFLNLSNYTNWALTLREMYFLNLSNYTNWALTLREMYFLNLSNYTNWALTLREMYFLQLHKLGPYSEVDVAIVAITTEDLLNACITHTHALSHVGLTVKGVAWVAAIDVQLQGTNRTLCVVCVVCVVWCVCVWCVCGVCVCGVYVWCVCGVCVWCVCVVCVCVYTQINSSYRSFYASEIMYQVLPAFPYR